MKRQTHEEAHNCIPATVANNEPSTGDEPLGEEEIKRFDGKVDVDVHSKRYRLTDPDDGGGSPKYLIDKIVKLGILKDDSPREIRNFTKSQEKVSKAEAEEVIVTITEAEE